MEEKEILGASTSPFLLMALCHWSDSKYGAFLPIIIILFLLYFHIYIYVRPQTLGFMWCELKPKFHLSPESNTISFWLVDHEQLWHFEFSWLTINPEKISHNFQKVWELNFPQCAVILVIGCNSLWGMLNRSLQLEYIHMVVLLGLSSRLSPSIYTL